MTASKQLTIRLNNADNVVVSRVDIPSGADISEEKITCLNDIPFGHKVAVTHIKSGAAVK